MKNGVQLISYADRLSNAGIPALNKLLKNQLSGLFSGVHILPFYYPIDGSDAGFDPIDHNQVDNRIGEWSDVKAMGENVDLMADLIVNHMSAQSMQFQDVLAKGRDSVFWELFLTQDKVFPDGMSDQQQDAITKPKEDGCFTAYQLASGENVNFWTTFTSNQIDINVESNAGQHYLDTVLNTFAANNMKLVRLDAAGFAIKQAGTSCFMLDQTFEYIDKLSDQINSLGMESLVEVHSHYQTQIEIAKKVNLVYDFALPPLVLHALFSNDAAPLLKWLAISPRNCLSVLDTHDGIGIEDVAPTKDKSGLLDDQQIEQLITKIHQNCDGQSLKASGAAASNVDIYQVNCSYYSALGNNDFDYLVARAIQFFAPGTPQVYYGGLLAIENDMKLLAKTNVGRDISRPYIDDARLEAALERKVVKALMSLITLRNENNAFGGEFNIAQTDASFSLCWTNQQDSAQLNVDLAARVATIDLKSAHQAKTISLAELLA